LRIKENGKHSELGKNLEGIQEILMIWIHFLFLFVCGVKTPWEETEGKDVII
jgi:hypothetical protein